MQGLGMDDSSRRSHSNSEKKDTKQEDEPELHKIKPKPNEKFRPPKVRPVIKSLISQAMADMNMKEFDNDTAHTTCKTLSSTIKERLKNSHLDRYKYVVQVSIGEKKGQGVRMVNRCFWDSETDNMIVETFMNDKLFCTVTIYAVYCY